MQSSAEVALGDLVEYGGERGVVCCTDPLIMRCTQVHAYVPIVQRLFLVEVTPGFEDAAACTIRPEIVHRIRTYLDTTKAAAFEADRHDGTDDDDDVPTGGGV